MMKRSAGIIAALVLGFFIFGQPFYTVDETEQVIITQFGKPVGDAVTDAGLHFKVPFIQTATASPRTCLSGTAIPARSPRRIRPLSGFPPLPGGA